VTEMPTVEEWSAMYLDALNNMADTIVDILLPHSKVYDLSQTPVWTKEAESILCSINQARNNMLCRINGVPPFDMYDS